MTQSCPAHIHINHHSLISLIAHYQYLSLSINSDDSPILIPLPLYQSPTPMYITIPYINPHHTKVSHLFLLIPLFLIYS